MSYREKENIVNIISGLVIMPIFGWIIYQKHLQGIFDLTQDYQMWGKLFLIFIGISIVARIVIYIIFHIINAITTHETDIPVEDERDKLIKLKASRNSHYAYMFVFISAFILLAAGMPVYGLFIALGLSGLLSEIIENVSQLYYHRKGI